MAWRETSPPTGAFSWPQMLNFSHITYVDSLEPKLEAFAHTCFARTPPRLWNKSVPPSLLQTLEGLWWLLCSKERWFSWELYSYCEQFWFRCPAMPAMCLTQCAPWALHPPKKAAPNKSCQGGRVQRAENILEDVTYTLPKGAPYCIQSFLLSYTFPFLESIASKEV